MPFFSIIVPVYKVPEPYLRQCIESICLQSFSNYELILVDDGSPDQCGSICDEYAKKYSQITVIHKPNGGVSSARNFGIRAAKGIWLMFVDGDDYIAEHVLQDLYVDAVQFKSADIIQFRAFRDYGTKAVPLKMPYQLRHLYSLSSSKVRVAFCRNIVQPSSFLRKWNVRSTLYYSWDKLFRREFLVHDALFYTEGLRVSEDKLFVLQCLRKAERYVFVDTPVYYYRINSDSVTQRYSATIDSDRLKVFDLLHKETREIDCMYHLKGTQSLCYHLYAFVQISVSGVLIRKFYHKDNPDKQGRRKAALQYLHEPIIAEAFRTVPLSVLTAKNVLRILLIRLRLFQTHTLLQKALTTATGKRAL